MDDTFLGIYRILKVLRDSLDYEYFDESRINPERIGITKPKWCRIMKMLVDDGYIKGVNISQTLDSSIPDVTIGNVSITIKGLEYLQDNSIMKKVANILKGLADVVS